MTNLAGLHKRARKAAEHRGHDILGWHIINGHEAYARCAKCGKRVYVYSPPLSDGTSISGEAITQDCREHLTVEYLVNYLRGYPLGTEILFKITLLEDDLTPVQTVEYEGGKMEVRD